MWWDKKKKSEQQKTIAEFRAKYEKDLADVFKVDKVDMEAYKTIGGLHVGYDPGKVKTSGPNPTGHSTLPGISLEQIMHAMGQYKVIPEPDPEFKGLKSKVPYLETKLLKMLENQDLYNKHLKREYELPIAKVLKGPKFKITFSTITAPRVTGQAFTAEVVGLVETEYQWMSLWGLLKRVNDNAPHRLRWVYPKSGGVEGMAEGQIINVGLEALDKMPYPDAAKRIGECKVTFDLSDVRELSESEAFAAAVSEVTDGF